MNRPELKAAVQADLRLTGDLTNPHVEGDAKLDRAAIRLWDFIEAPSDPESIWKTWPFFKNMVANIQMSAAKNVWIRDRDFNIEIEGDVDLRKDLEGIRLYGAVRSRQGRYEFLNRSFKIDDGAIQFQGRREIDPDVAILGFARRMTAYKRPD